MNSYNIKNNIHTSNIQWPKGNIIPKGRNEGIVKKGHTKAKLKPNRENSTPYSSRACDVIVGSKELGLPLPLFQLFLQHTEPLSGQLHSLPVAFLSGHLMVLASLISWGLHCDLGFTFTALHHGLSRLLCRDSHFYTWPGLSSSLNWCKTP